VNPSQPPPPPAGGPSTREIPVVTPAGATAAPATAQATTTAQATGPVDWMPGPQSVAPAAPAPPAAGTTRQFLVDLADEPAPRRPGAGVRAAALLAGVVAAGALELGLLAHGGTASLWSRTPLWSAFATVAVVAGLAGVAARLAGNRPWARAVALTGLGGLAVFWLLVALPSADSDRGFLLTAGLACLAAAVWTSGREETTAATASRHSRP
jgi:hypothetical protein